MGTERGRAGRPAGTTGARVERYLTRLVREKAAGYGAAPMGAVMRGPEDVARIFQPMAGKLDRETFWTVYLDGRNAIMGWEVVSVGTASAALVHPREVYRGAIIAGAVSVIGVHNHPSGNPSPSQEDRDLCKRLADAGDLVGIRFLEGLTVTADSWAQILP